MPASTTCLCASSKVVDPAAKPRHDGQRADMKPAPFTYTRAVSVAQAIDLLATEPDARLLAGGQSLGPMLNLRLARPTRLIDIKRAPELRMLETDSRHLRLGACWTHAEIEDATIEDPTNGLLPHVARGIAYRAVRNRGTVGGSLAHADPAADWLATMAVLGAAIIVQGSGGARRCAATAFVQGPFATALGPAELIVAVEVPRLSPGARWATTRCAARPASSPAPLAQRSWMTATVSPESSAAPPAVPRSSFPAPPPGWRKPAPRRRARSLQMKWPRCAVPRPGRCTRSPYAAHWRSLRLRTE